MSQFILPLDVWKYIAYFHGNQKVRCKLRQTYSYFRQHFKNIPPAPSDEKWKMLKPIIAYEECSYANACNRLEKVKWVMQHTARTGLRLEQKGFSHFSTALYQLQSNNWSVTSAILGMFCK